MLQAPVYHERDLPLLIVIMLSAPLKLDHSSVLYREHRPNRNVLDSVRLLPLFKSNSSRHLLPFIVGLGAAINHVMPRP